MIWLNMLRTRIRQGYLSALNQFHFHCFYDVACFLWARAKLLKYLSSQVRVAMSDSSYAPQKYSLRRHSSFSIVALYGESRRPYLIVRSMSSRARANALSAIAGFAF